MEGYMERESFIRFRNKFARYSLMNSVQISMYAPLFYSMEDDFYFACLKYLETGEENNIICGEYSAATIKETMQCEYLESLIILSNIRKMPEMACYIYRPRIVE